MNDCRYRAFISYSHQDAAWSRWLHRALESYRVPRALVGQVGARGPVPARLGALFRDREELASSHDLGGRVLEALQASASLIVICSPQAARSRWVNEEILAFQALGRAQQIFCLIADGEPHSGDARECFPAALRSAGHPGGAAVFEPIAADARPSGDGRSSAKLKLIAGLLGVPLDALRQRDLRRRQRQMLAITSASVLGMLLTLGLTVTAVRAQREAQRQQAQAEGLIEFMLGDLRLKLESLGRLEVLDVVGTRALDYYADQPLGGLDSEAIGRRSRALTLIGQIDFQRRELDSAQIAFSEAAEATRALLEREPESDQVLHDHLQSLSMLSYVAFVRGDLSDAETRTRQYLDFANRLAARRPTDPLAQKERHDALSNLGEVLHRTGRGAEGLPLYREALALAQNIRRLDESVGLPLLLIDHSRLATALQPLGRFDEAESHLLAQLALEDQLLASDPLNAQTLERKLGALAWLGALHQGRGKLSEALAVYRDSRQITALLLHNDPSNDSLRERDAVLASKLAEAALRQRDSVAARASLDEARQWFQALSAEQPAVSETRRRLTALDLLEAELSLLGGDLAAARYWAQRALSEARTQATGPDIKLAEGLARALRVAGEVEAASGNRPAADLHWQEALRVLGEPGEAEATARRELRAVLHHHTGSLELARSLIQELRSAGYAPLIYDHLLEDRETAIRSP